MNLTEFINSPWAITQQSLTEIQSIYAAHCKGEKIDIAAVEARLNRPLANEQQAYTVRDGGIAVLPIDGVMAPKANLMMQISGGASTQMLAKQVESALVDPRVKGMVLAIDSPGGSVLGTPELADTVRLFGASKPIVAVTDGVMASAAYWVGSAANAVYLSGPTVNIGSIGVIARLGWDKPDPTGVTIAKGKYKRASLNGEAPSADYLNYFEGQLDHLYSVFVQAVSDNRGTTADVVLARMADGRVFVGQQGVDAGLADGFLTVDQAAEAMAASPEKFAKRKKAAFAAQTAPAATTQQQASQPQATQPATPPKPTKAPMDKATLQATHPDLYAQLRAEISAEAVTAELARQSGVRAAALPGHDKLIEQMATDGTTTPEQAAMAVLRAEQQSRQAAATGWRADAPPPVASSVTPTAATSGQPETDASRQKRLHTEAVALSEKEKISYSAAFSVVAAADK